MLYIGSICVNGISTESNERPSNPVVSLFDGLTYTEWYPAVVCPVWVKYDLGIGISKVPKGYGLYPYEASSGRYSASGWVFEASKDDITWDVLDTQTNAVLAGNKMTRFSIPNIKDYRYFRFTFTAAGKTNPTGNIVDLYELDIYDKEIPPSKTNICVNGTPSASADDGGSYPAANAFDGSSDDWYPNLPCPQWIKYDLGVGVSKVPKSYFIKPYENSSETYGIRSWVFEGSVDDFTWTILDTQTDYELSGSGKEFSVSSNTKSFRYFRWTCLKPADGDPSVDIIELEVYDVVDIVYPEGFCKTAVAFSASAFSPSLGPEKAFDGDSSTVWWSGNNTVCPQWIYCDLGVGVSKIPKGYGIEPATSYEGSGGASAWLFEGSKDALTWETLDSQSNIHLPYGRTDFLITSNTKGYRFFRWYFTAPSKNGTAIEIKNLWAYEEDMSGTKPPVDDGGGIDLDGWVSQGKFFIERPTFQIGVSSTETGLWGRQNTAVLGEPFAQKVTKLWQTDVSFYEICKEILESVGLTWDPDCCDLQDFTIFADTFEADNEYPIEVLKKLVLLLVAEEGFITSDKDGQIWIRRLNRFPENSVFNITDLIVQSMKEEPVWPEFGNRIKIIPTVTQSQEQLEIYADNMCIGDGAAKDIAIYAQAKDGAGNTINDAIVKWSFEPEIPKEVWLRYPTMAKTSEQNTANLLVSNERQRATGFNSVQLAFEPSTIIGIWAYADSLRTYNFAPENGYVINGRDVFLTKEHFIYCNQQVFISYIAAGMVRNIIHYDKVLAEPIGSEDVFGTVILKATMHGKEVQKEVYVNNSCKCTSTLAVKVDPTTITVGREIATIEAYLENSGVPVAGTVRMVEVSGKGSLEWNSAETAVIQTTERTEAINAVFGQSQCVVSSVIDSVTGVWKTDDDNVKIGPNLFTTYYGRTIDIGDGAYILTETPLLVEYGRAGTVTNYLTGIGVGVSRVEVSSEVTTEEGLVQTVQVTVNEGETPPAEKGQINFISSPSNAEVYFGGTLIGNTPYTKTQIDAGNYSVTISKTGYSSYETSVEVRDGDILTVQASLQPTTSTKAKITFLSSPTGANVSLNGSNVGTTSCEKTNLDAGTYSVVISKTGYNSYSTSVTVKDNDNITISATLSPTGTTVTTATLNVQSTPTGATVTYDGSSMGTTNCSKTNCTPGTHSIVVSKSGYQSYSTSVTLAAGDNATIVCTLASGATEKAQIRCSSSPSGANVYINNAYFGLTTCLRQGLDAGTYAITMTKTGYQSYNTSVTVEDGDEVEVDCTLVPVGAANNGIVNISSNPTGATVYMDDVNKGTTPARITNITAGNHNFKCTKSGYQDYTWSEVIADNTERSYTVTLYSASGTINVSSSPTGADVYINGVNKGTTPYSGSYPAGDYSVSVSKTGYTGYSWSSFRLETGATANLSATLAATGGGGTGGGTTPTVTYSVSGPTSLAYSSMSVKSTYTSRGISYDYSYKWGGGWSLKDSAGNQYGSHLTISGQGYIGICDNSGNDSVNGAYMKVNVYTPSQTVVITAYDSTHTKSATLNCTYAAY